MIFRGGSGILHNDIIIQKSPNVLTEFSSGAMLYVVSTWTINKDTITTTPNIEYGSRQKEFWYNPIDDTDSTVTSLKKHI